MTPVDTAAIAERVEAVAGDAKRLTLKWNYNEYGMIRDMYTGRAYANVFVKPFDEFYLNAPADIRALLAENTSLKAEVAALTARAEAAEAKLAEYVMLEATDLDGNDWTLEADQMLFMMNLNNVIEAANTGDKEAFETLLDLAVSNEYKTLFGEMGLDEAIYRYQSTLEVGRHFNALEATPANGGNDEQ